MKLRGLIFKNVLRQKTRTLLTLVGISIGIATIIALGAVADGLKSTFEGIVNTGEADFIVAQAGTADLALSRIDEDRVRELKGIDGVAQAEGVSVGVTGYGDSPFFVIFGMREAGMELAGIHMVDGRHPIGDGEIVIGKIAKATTGVEVGDTMELFGSPQRVVGIFETGQQMQDGGGVMELTTMQELSRTGDKVTMALVKTEKNADINALTELIDDVHAGELITVKSVEEISRVDQGGQMIDAATWMISALAIVIGGIGVMNTMIISVYDRIREIGVLKAVGWKRRTIVSMVLGEAVIIGLASVVVGSALAMAVLIPLSNSAVVQSFLAPSYSWGLWAQATVVAVLVSVIGGLYPAWKAANFSPIEALRYE